MIVVSVIHSFYYSVNRITDECADVFLRHFGIGDLFGHLLAFLTQSTADLYCT